jgi:hypothetical protein
VAARRRAIQFVSHRFYNLIQLGRAAPTQSPRMRIEQLIPRLTDRWRQFIGNFEKRILPEDIPAFRQEIGRLIGPIRVRATPEEILLETQEGHTEVTFLRAAGFDEPGQQISLVAGAGFLRITRELIVPPRGAK